MFSSPSSSSSSFFLREKGKKSLYNQLSQAGEKMFCEAHSCLLAFWGNFSVELAQESLFSVLPFLGGLLGLEEEEEEASFFRLWRSRSPSRLPPSPPLLRETPKGRWGPSKNSLLPSDAEEMLFVPPSALCPSTFASCFCLTFVIIKCTELQYTNSVIT